MTNQQFPIKIAYPNEPWIAAPEGQSELLPDGRLLVTYNDIEELRWCIMASQMAKERAEGEGSPAGEGE